jgi:hypothetical protein|tara:strand:+ start:2638 stop:2874 length:237 start_codon:yes stop_codon:yes gene_type:complete
MIMQLLKEGYPGFIKVKVPDTWRDIDPPCLMEPMWGAWTDEEQQSFINHFRGFFLSQIEERGGFICLPVEDDSIMWDD